MRRLISAFLLLLVAAPVFGQSVQTRGTLSATGSVQLDVTGMGTASVTVSGTYVGTVQFEVVGEPGTAAVSVDCATPDQGTTGANSTTSTGVWTCPVAGLSMIQARMSAYTSGTAVIFLKAAPGGGGSSSGGGGGSNAAASATGSSVPSSASYEGVNIGGTLTGVTGIAAGATHKAQVVAIVDSSGNQISTFGGSGGTSVNEDVLSANADPGTPAYTVRNDTLTGATTANGDYQPTKSTAAGAIYITPTYADVIASTGVGASGAQTPRVVTSTDSTIGTVTTVSTVTNLSQLAGAAVPMTTTQADDLANTLDGLNTTSFLYAFDGTTWDRMPGTSALGLTVNSEMPAAAALADDTANPTVPAVAAMNMCFDGTTWDRCRASTLTEAIEDAGETAGGVGTYAMTVRRDTPATSASATAENATLNTNNVGALWVAQIDPCSSEAKITDPFSLTARGVIVAATSAKKNYICAIVVVAGAAEIFNVVEGTGTTCQTGTAAIAGSTTAANGLSLAANGGFSAIGSNSTVLAGKTANVDTCIVPSSTNRLSGFVTYVQR